MDFSIKIKDRTLEYIDDDHIYLVDGVIVPSITQILKIEYGNKYDNVSEEVLQRANEKGTEVHEAIERYCVDGIESDLVEVKNFKFLQRQYKFEVVSNEVPVILCKDNVPVSAGRLDLVLKMDNKIGLADIKRTYVLDKHYVASQLNLYRIAYQQCYDQNIEFLRAVHLREDVRKFVNLPIDKESAYSLLDKYERSEN